MLSPAGTATGRANARFENRVALVTGSAAGIGRATAIAFAREGARVTIADIDRDGGEETVRLIRDAGGEAMFVATDVSQSTEVARMVDQTVRRFGRLDCASTTPGSWRRAGPGD